MARLPEIRPQSVFNPIPPDRPTDAGSPFAALAATFDTIAKVTGPLAIQEAAAKGAEAVGRDASGGLVADTRIPFTPIDEAYNAAAQSIYITEMDGDVQARVSAMSEQFYNDPVGFQQAVKTYRAEVMKTVPTVFKGDVATLISQRAGSANNQIIRASYTETRGRALNANEAAINRISEEITRLAANPTQENIQEIGRMNQQLADLRQVRIGLPGSGYTQENAALEADRLQERVLAANDTAMRSATNAALDTMRLGEIPSNIDDVLEMVGGTEYEAQLKPFIAARELDPTFAMKGPAEREAVIEGLRSGEVNKQTAEVIGALEKVDEQLRELTKADAIGAAQNTGMVVPAIDPNDPESYVRRAEFAVNLAEQGMNPNGALLSAEEVDAMRTIIKEGDPAQVVQTISAMTQFGSDGFTRAFQQIGSDGEMKGVIELVAGGANPEITTSAVAGMRLSKAKRGLDNADRVKGIESVMGALQDAMASPNIELQRQKVALADLIYADMVENQGAKEGRDTWESALHQSLGGKDGVGGLVDMGRQGKVILPPDVMGTSASGRFKTIISEYDDAVYSDLNYSDDYFTSLGEISPEGGLKIEADKRAAYALAKSVTSDKFRQFSRSGGFPTYRGEFPDLDMMENVKIISIGADSYVLNYNGITLADSENPDKPYTFSIRKMVGQQ